MWIKKRAEVAKGMNTADALDAWLREGGDEVLRPILGEEAMKQIDDALEDYKESVKNAAIDYLCGAE